MFSICSMTLTCVQLYNHLPLKIAALHIIPDEFTYNENTEIYSTVQFVLNVHIGDPRCEFNTVEYFLSVLLSEVFSKLIQTFYTDGWNDCSAKVNPKRFNCSFMSGIVINPVSSMLVNGSMAKQKVKLHVKYMFVSFLAFLFKLSADFFPVVLLFIIYLML